MLECRWLPIQREQINQQQISNLFWLSSALGLLAAVVVAALSPGIAWFYNEPRLIAITVALSASFILSGLTIQHQALLRRGMQFTALAVIQVISVGIANVLAIVVAWHYRSYWALVVLPIVHGCFETGNNVAGVCVVAGFAAPRLGRTRYGRLRRQFDRVQFRQLFCPQRRQHVDRLVVGSDSAGVL